MPRVPVLGAAKRVLMAAIAALSCAFAAVAALSDASPALAAPPVDSSLADTARVVRTEPPILIRASRLDVLSSETRRRISGEQLRALPLDRAADALALEPGVVVDGEIVHVRGARPGELRVELDGIGLNEPLRGEPFALPLVALEDLELLRGGLDAEHGGGLAGTLLPRPAFARDRWAARLLWVTDGGTATHDDRVGARVAGPIGASGLGLALAGEAHLDDTHEPALRTPQHTRVLGVPFGWRARNDVTALARLSPVRDPAAFAMQAIVSRRLLRPFNPMFSLVGWTSPCPDDSCLRGPAYSPTPVRGGRFAPYDAADHYPVTDVQRAAVVASAQRRFGPHRLRAALGWNHERRLTAVDGRDDESALAPARALLWGVDESATSDRFHVYAGDAPWYRKSRAEWLEARADWRREWRSGSAVSAGAGATHERVRVRELDFAFVPAPYDSIRIFTASAPGAWGWLAGRWVSEGMILNGGLRAEWFTPGPDADRTLHDAALHGTLSLSPRLGFSFPLGPRDAFQASYARLAQSPGREFLYDSRTARINPRHPLGNPALVPATAISYEFTLKHRENELWSAQAGFFYRDLFDQVSARNRRLFVPGGTASIDVLRYESADAGRALGLELTLERDDPGKSRLAATYTWMQTVGSQSLEEGLPVYPLRLPQPPPIQERPLSWDQPHRLTLQAIGIGERVRGAWTTVIASGLPWTPAAIREATTDLGTVNSRRLATFTISDASLETRPFRGLAALVVGLEIRNVFDFRGARRVSIDGWPHPVVNTQYDDYAAHREAAGGGPAFWNDLNGDGLPGWVEVSDPRLDFAPRLVRLKVEMSW